jgi:hypothetical protein
MRRNRGRALVALAIACGLAAAVPVTQAIGAGSKPDARLAVNAKHVNGISAGRKPTPNRLVPLTGKGVFPASTMNTDAASGHTYRGVFAVEGTAPAVTDPTVPANVYFIGGGLTLPWSSKVLEPGDAGILGGGLEVPDCEGDFTTPTAPPGKLCIYPGFASGGEINDDEADVLNVLKNGEGALEATPYVISGGHVGVRIEVQAAAPGRVKFAATWAYTAP